MRALAAAALAVAIGCAPSLPSSYHCTTDAQCTLSGERGVCQPNGACSFADGSCAGGQRYGSLGPPAVAGTCVADGSDLGSGGGGGEDGGGGSGGSITRVAVTTLPASSRMVVAIKPPAGVVAGDLVFATIYLADATVTITPPAGWTQHADLHGAVGGEFHAAWYWHVLGATEPPAFAFVLNASSNSTAAAVAYRGVDGAMPIDVAGQQQFEGAPLTAPSITTTRANDVLVAMFVEASSSGLPWSAPSGMQIAVDDGAVGIFDATQAAAGATGARTASGIPNIGAVDFVALAPK
jgi:hypothetical protein